MTNSLPTMNLAATRRIPGTAAQAEATARAARINASIDALIARGVDALEAMRLANRSDGAAR